MVDGEIVLKAVNFSKPLTICLLKEKKKINKPLNILPIYMDDIAASMAF